MFKISEISYKKYLYGYLLVLFGIMVSGMITSYILDKHNTESTNMVNISGKQRMLTTRIAYLAVSLKIHDLKNANGINHDLHNEHLRRYYLKELSSTITLLEKNHAILNKFFATDKRLYTLIMDFYDKPSTIGKSNRRAIHDFIENAKIIDAYFNKYHEDADYVPEKIAEIIDQIIRDKFYPTVSVFNDLTKTYVDFVNQKNKETRRYKIVLIIFFSLIITFSAVVTFYPIQKRLIHLARLNNIQKQLSDYEKNRLDLASKGTLTGIWDWDIYEEEIYCNDVTKTLLGLDTLEKNNLTSDNFQELLHPDDRDNFRANTNNHIKSKYPFYYECRILHTDGHYIWVCLRGQAKWDSKTNFAYRMVGSIEDITVRKEAEFNTLRLMKGIETTDIAFAILDIRDGARQFSYVSPRFYDITGYKNPELLSKNIDSFMGPETSLNSLSEIEYLIDRRKEATITLTSYRKNGNEFTNEITLSPIFPDDSKYCEYYIVLFKDKTKDILKERQEVNRQRNESLGSLAGGVAHEINNLLMPMTMAKDIIEGELKDDCDDFAREQLNTIDECASQAKEIVQGILTFSRKESENITEINIYDELKNSTNFIRNLINTKTNLNMEEPVDEVKNTNIMANRVEIRQILTNLVKNAEHAFNNNTGDIYISLDKCTLSKNQKAELNVHANDFVKIDFKDNGAGIPRDIIASIFDPLFTTKPVGEGTGLGLSVVMGIIKSWGGNITVESTEGKGAIFHIYIPILRDEDDFSDLEDLLDDL